MNYAADIERAAAEARHRSAQLLSELADLHRRTETRGQRLAERSAAEMAQYWEDNAEAIERTLAEAEEREQREAAERAEQQRVDEEAREQREAIARSVANRRANDVVTPSDEDDDPEGAYYRRKSWLI